VRYRRAVSVWVVVVTLVVAPRIAEARAPDVVPARDAANLRGFATDGTVAPHRAPCG